MPYKSKAELEHARYMTLAEAINCISKRDNCSRRAATDQIRAALADNQLGPIRWEDRLKYIVNDYPPLDRKFWQGKASIPDRRGRIFDSFTEQPRTLLILKDSIFQIWPEPSAASATSAPITKAKGGRRSARDQVDKAYDGLLRQNPSMKTMAPMEVAKLIAKECGKKLGDPLWVTRTVLGHIQRLRAEH